MFPFSYAYAYAYVTLVHTTLAYAYAYVYAYAYFGVRRFPYKTYVLSAFHSESATNRERNRKHNAKDLLKVGRFLFQQSCLLVPRNLKHPATVSLL